MEFVRYEGSLMALDVDVLALGVHQDSSWLEQSEVEAIDEALGGLLATVVGEEKFEAKDGQILRLHTHGRIAARRLVVFGLGKDAEYVGRTVASRAVREAHRLKLRHVGVVAPAGEAVTATQLVIGSLLAEYSFDEWKTGDNDAVAIEQVHLVGTTGHEDVPRAARFGEAVCLARDLVNHPPIRVTPTEMARCAEQMASEHGLECTILDKEALEKKGMRLILAVSAGSVEEPRLIHLTYRPTGATDSTPSVALVGKGLTFDAGGLNLKPTGHIEEMKMDMGGGAAVLGAMKAVSALAPNLIVHGIVPSSENLTGAAAYKPGDIIKSYLGKTVEVLNTDAEGRLILADALAYAVELEPSEIVDLATLTGAICVALGNDTVGLFSNRDELASEFLEAANLAGESLWHMPLDHKLRKQLKSDNADIKNIGKRWGGAITAALFLHEFIGETDWVHLDIAGPAFSEKARDHLPKGGTGVGVLTLLSYLERAASRLAN
jgi:leucyl aminopeptidase